MPTGLTPFHEELLALLKDAKRARRRNGQQCSLREIEKALKHSPGTSLTYQRISDWTSVKSQTGQPKTPVLPSPGSSEEVIALVRLLSEWAGRTLDNEHEHEWRTLHDRSQRDRGLATRARVDAGGLDRRVVLAGLASVPTVSPLFEGRRDELTRLDEMLSGSDQVPVAAMYGLGGVGKTTLAARYVQTHAERFTLVWWITADTPATLDASLAKLAVALDLDTVPSTQEERATAAVGWLAEHQGWLLVLDNLPGPEGLPPRLQRLGDVGTVLVTSRRSTGWRGVTTLPVTILPPEDATQLFVRTVRTDWSDADLTGIEALCAELDGLPLAIEQAGAYIAQTRITPAHYRELLADYPARTFTKTAEGGSAQPALARVWHVTLDRLADTPAAGRVLRRLAWYAPDNIYRALVIGTSPDLDEVDALGRLAAYSMITLDANTICIHRLVQAIARDPDTADLHHQPEGIVQARATVVECLGQALRGLDYQRPADWPAFQAVIPHALALLDHTSSDDDTRESCVLGLIVARFVFDQGDAVTAVQLFTRVSDSLERLCGRDDLYALEARSGLGEACGVAGNVDRAIPLLKASLSDHERVLGPDHESTIIARGNLANGYRSAGELHLAVSLHQAVVADCERVLGFDDQRTLVARADLGATLADTGDASAAISILEAVHIGLATALGSEHPTILTVQTELAKAYASIEDLDRAVALLEKTNRVQRRVIGLDHIHSLIARDGLASAYRSRGETDRAISIYKDALEGCEKTLGPDHRGTLIARCNLADAYRSAGEFERAVPLLEASMSGHERILGPGHPDTLIARKKLAYAYREARNLMPAARLYRAMLEDRCRAVGGDHPDSLDLQADLACIYLLADNFKRAISLYENTLTSRERVLGPVHPQTLDSRHNLAFAYRVSGDLHRAIPLYEAALAGYEQVFGRDQKNAIIARSNLAGACGATGDADRAIRLYKLALADAEKVFGIDDDLTESIRANLSFATSSDGRSKLSFTPISVARRRSLQLPESQDE
ncbi:FxSxx-COOH system tetratricopeptide repeat protein [Amycolatopsis sp. NPDC004169]|uniref:FxSxx-COOH system tetratricopeptide repeat protein n=1 Tax=Amycolatopsis sp. NPDC004169 TaxID=3154453 RepID=UPI0033A8A304